MTIRKGGDWGSEVDRPEGLIVAADDAEVARLFALQEPQAIAVASGDLFTTIGGRPVGDRDRLLRLPIDVVEVSLDGREPVVSVAHVVARTPWYLGSWWRGGVLAVMNAEFIGEYDVAPRGHPNDGRVEAFELSASARPRQRNAIRRRMRSGTHLPHPAISHRPVRSGSWSFDSPRVVLIDGVMVGRATRIEIAVRPDAGHLHA